LSRLKPGNSEKTSHFGGQLKHLIGPPAKPQAKVNR